MASNTQAETVADLDPDLPLADVIQMPNTEHPSFYTRNTAALPRLDEANAGNYRRASLPTPVEPEPDTVLNRFKAFVSVNRPSWLPQR